MTDSLKRAAWRGSAITLVGHGASAAIRLGANLIITRLLVPEHFGVMALVNVFLIGLQLFSDVGVGPNIIQSPRGDDPVFLDTAWTVQAIRGAVLWGVACLIAWPMARFYGHPQLTWLIPVAGISMLVSGFESTKLFTQARQLSFARITALELASHLVGVLSMIAVGWLTRSVWSLVVSMVAWAVFRTAMSHLVLPGHANRFAWEARARQELVAFGRWILVSTAITFLASQFDRLILGKMVSVAELGFYSIAANLAGLAPQIIGQLSQKVFYPVVASAMRRPDHDPASIRATRMRLLAALVPVLAIGIAMSPQLVELMYDDRYRAVGVLASLFCIGAWLSTLASSYGVVLLAAGKPKFLSLGNAAKLILLASAIGFVVPRFGVVGAALVVSLSELGLVVVSALACRPLGTATIGADLGLCVAVAALVGIFLFVHRFVLSATSQPLAALGTVVALGLGATGVVARRCRLL